MTDIFTKRKRSEIMSRIRGKWTKQERRAHNILKGNRIPHRMHPRMLGNPDILIKANNTVVFLDGCFWHGCPRHSKIPKTNRPFWKAKIAANMARDRKNMRGLKRMNVKVVRIWECSLSTVSLLKAAGAGK